MRFSTAPAAVLGHHGGRERSPVGPGWRFKSLWPNLEIDAKDVEAAHHWYEVEAQLSRAFPDARCHYRWLDPFKHGPHFPGAVSEAAPTFTFADMMEQMDFPDDSYFERWCEERRHRRKENRRANVPSGRPIGQGCALDCGDPGEENISANGLNTLAGHGCAFEGVGTCDRPERTSVLKESTSCNRLTKHESPRLSKLVGTPLSARRRQPEPKCDPVKLPHCFFGLGRQREQWAAQGAAERPLTSRAPSRELSQSTLHLACRSAR